LTTTYQPALDDTSDLGAAGKQWKNLYVAEDIYGAGNTYTFPAAGGVFVTTAGTQTLTNKTLTAPVIAGAGTINSCPIGGSTPAAGSFTSLIATGGGGSAINNVPIGGSTPAAGSFTTMTGSDNTTLTVLGKTYRIKEGSNACMGTATLSSGVATVSTTAAAATSRIFVTGQSTSGALYTKNRINGTSFAIYSTDNADTGDAAWVILNPAP
jgi:hypothetical protein